MPYEDFTTYTEVDPNSHLSKTANHVDHKGYRNEDCYLYYDKGADHFGDFTHLVDFKPVSSGSASYAWEIPWMLSNDVDDWVGLKTASKTCIGVHVETGYNGQPPHIMTVIENYAGTLYYSSTITVVMNTQYYLTIVKSGTTLTLHIYTDAARTQEISGSPQSLTLHGDWKFRYVFASNVYNDGTDTNKWIDVDIDNLDLQEFKGLAGSIVSIMEVMDLV